MANESWDYGAKERIDQQILDDYNSEDYEVGDVADDYEEICPDVDGGEEAGKKPLGEREFAFGDLDEPLQDWEFDGMQMEKHSRGARARKRQQRKEARAAEAARRAEEAAAAAEAKAAEEEAAAEARAAAEEARRAEEEQQAAFERVSKTVQAPIAAATVGDMPMSEPKPEEDAEI